MEIKDFIGKNYPDGFYPNGKPLTRRREEFNRRNSQWLCNDKQVDVVFFGDSITEWWEVYAYFSKYGVLVNRGFAGEQIKSAVKRFNADVVDLKPKVAVLFEGTNDISVLYSKIKDKNLSDKQLYKQVEKISLNHEKIIRIAIDGGLKLIVCSVLPYGCKDKRNEMIVMLNKMIKGLCEKYSLPFADFHSVLVEEDGLTLKPVHFGDDLHPHVLGYNEMAKVLYPHLDKAIFNKRK